MLVECTIAPFRGVAVNLSTTPFVQYDYSEADTGNHSRLTKITYPDGYELDYNYATGVDDNISRLTSISDSTGTLESYAYQGEATVLERNHSQPGLDLTTTLDDFGRISDFNWTNSGGGSVSHYAYGYDAAGNRLYKGMGWGQATFGGSLTLGAVEGTLSTGATPAGRWFLRQVLGVGTSLAVQKL